MGAPDFSGLRSLAEDWMSDTTARITRPGGEAVLDEFSGDLVEPDPVLIYQGDGMILPIGAGDVSDPTVQRIVETTGASYKLLIPVGVSAEVRAGDDVRALNPRGIIVDPLLTSRRWKVTELGDVSSVAVVRFIYLRQTATSAP